MLKDNKVLVTDRIEKEDEVYLKWKEGTISLRHYLIYAIALFPVRNYRQKWNRLSMPKHLLRHILTPSGHII